MSRPDTLVHPRLFVIRHSDTDWTDAHRHTGRTDIALNAKGEARAVLLAERLSGRTFANVFASPLTRVRQTCALAGFGDHAEIVAELAEWNMGDDEGRTTSQIREGRPAWDMFRDGPANGESLAQVTTRAERFVAHARECTGDIAAFASGQIIRCIAARWLGLSPLAAKCFRVDTCSVGILSYEHNLDEPVVSLWNDLGPQLSARSEA